MIDIGAIYDELAEGYVSRREEREFEFGEFLGSVIHVLLKRRSNPGKNLSILDVGCGYGVDMLAFHKRFSNDKQIAESVRLFGIDLSEWMIAKAKELGMECRCADFRSVSGLNDQWDFVWCNMVLIHVGLNEVDEALAKLKSFLMPGGLLGLGIKILREGGGKTLGCQVVDPAHGTINRDRNQTYFDFMSLKRLLPQYGLAHVSQMTMPSHRESYDYSWFFCQSVGQ